jgi:hypothetical protein
MPEANVKAFPDTQVLAKALTKVLTGTANHNTDVVILNRQEFRGSTFPVEVVSCQLPYGKNLRVFCKYEAGRSHAGNGHRGGVSYEADVYETALRPSECSVPFFFGCHRDQLTGDTWLFIENLDLKSIRGMHSPACEAALREAARWAGCFHVELSERAKTCSKIKRYDAGYYQGFVNRVIEFSKGRRRRYPWLTSVCGRADEFISQLLSVPPTIIHGEFYPGNILYGEARLCPVDWESAAIAPGELDLASLTEGWPPELTGEWEREYATERWPEGAPVEFQRTLAAARLYWAFRWLGASPESVQKVRRPERKLERMLEEAKRWPLI